MLRFIMLTALSVFAVETFAQVIIENPTDEGCQKSIHNTLSITITEDLTDDFNLATGVDQTLIFELTSGTFDTSKGDVEFLREGIPDEDVNFSESITPTRLTVTLHADNENHLSFTNSLVLINIGVKSQNVELVDIKYMSGSASVNGLVPDLVVQSVNFNPLPTGEAGAVTTCGDAPLGFALQPDDQGYTFNWSADVNLNVQGENSGEENSITDNLLNKTDEEQIVTYRVRGEEPNFNCVSEEFLVLVTVNPAPNISAAAPAVVSNGTSVCIDTEVRFEATNTENITEFTWSAGGSYVPAVTSPGGGPNDKFFKLKWTSTSESTISVSYTNQFGCSGFGGINLNINNNETPVAPINGEVTDCRSAIGDYELGPLISPFVVTEFLWVAAGNANVEGESTTPVPGPSITDYLLNATLTDQIVVYTVTPKGACGTGAQFTVTLTLHPEPVGSPGSTIVCDGTEIDFELDPQITNGVASFFEWNAIENTNLDDISVNTQYTSVISDSPTLLDGAGATEVGVYEVMPSSSDFNCHGQPFEVNVTIAAAPSAEPLVVNICGNTAAGVDLQAQVSEAVPSTFSWLPNEDSPFVTGESTAAQSTSTITDILTTLSTSEETVSYNVIPTSVTGSCEGPTFIVDVAVKGIPEADDTSLSICSGVAQNFDINAHYALGGGLPVSSFSWLAAENVSVSGETTTPQATSSITEIITNATAASQDLIYTITPTGPDGCTGIPFIYTLTAMPAPTTNIINTFPAISSTGSTNITLSSPVASSTFAYTVSAPPEISGTSDGAGESILQALTNSTTLQRIVTYTITATANGCSGSAVVATITVRGDPTMNQNDSLALVALYNALDGTNWTSQTNWLSGPANTWSGVSVSSERLTSLALPANNLTGPLPVAFFNAPLLNLLDLRNNNINGALPAEISNLTALQFLNLQNNQMDGVLPNSLFFLINLTQLNLRGNDFTGSIPSAISNLTNLQTFQAEGLPMSGPIPSEVFGLTSLVNLGLSGKINGPLPATIGSLTSLLTFSCDSCAITAIPAAITGLTNLTSLRLQNNTIQNLPNLSGLPLSYLDVSKNSLTFESLEPHVSVSTFVYAPQDTVGIPTSVLLQTTTPYTFTSNVGGSANQYAWKKNNVVIPTATSSTYIISSPVFEDEGNYESEVTSAIVPGLTLKTSPVIAKVSSLKRDSLSLLQVYNSTNGPAWTGVTGWKNGALSTWTGVVISANRVTGLNLASKGLSGALPVEFTDMRSLQTANLSGNNLTEIPAVNSMTALTNLNVSSNTISFGSLEPNVSVLAKLTYSPQKVMGDVSRDSIPAGSAVEFSAITSGQNNIYQWKRNNTNATGGTSGIFGIASINRQTMGEYFCEITNAVVPGLTLQTAKKTVLATADLSGKIKVSTEASATKGTVTLLRINESGSAFEKIKVKAIGSEGSYSFPKVVLDNYQILAFADTLTHVRALPTYYKNTLLWEEADTLFVNGNLSDLDIITIFEPGPPSGRGLISGLVQEEESVGAGGGRTKLPKPVKQVGVSARRVQNTGRGQDEILTLIAYVFTDNQGEFSLPNLPTGNYRLNIQYPGYPMDENSFINFTIGTGLEAEVKVEALVDKGVINVRQLIITGIWSKENYAADVFPNPTSSVINMRFETRSAYRDIGIFDISGKEIRMIDGSEEKVEINVSDFSKGLYLITVSEKGNLVKSVHVIIE